MTLYVAHVPFKNRGYRSILEVSREVPETHVSGNLPLAKELAYCSIRLGCVMNRLRCSALNSSQRPSSNTFASTVGPVTGSVSDDVSFHQNNVVVSHRINLTKGGSEYNVTNVLVDNATVMDKVLFYHLVDCQPPLFLKVLGGIREMPTDRLRERISSELGLGQS